MKKIFTVLILIMFSISGLAQDKSRLDLFQNDSKEMVYGLAKTSGDFRKYEKIGNSKLEISMVSGGYYTIGLTNGKSSTNLDNNCNVTYGHPFALTSFPYIIINGERLSIDKAAASLAAVDPLTGNNSITINTDIEQTLNVAFSIKLDDDEESVLIELDIKNNGNSVRSIGGGIIFDPALGKWGDGYVQLNSSFEENEFQLASDIPASFNIWERDKFAKGIGIEYSFLSSLPSKLYGYNWNKLNSVFNNDSYQNINDRIYDLSIMSEWEAQDLNPGASAAYIIRLNLLDPDFTSKVFTRWNIPRFIGIENSQIFPKSFSSFLEISNNNEIPISAEVQVISDDKCVFEDENLNIYLDKMPKYQRLESTFKTLYEDHISELTIEVKENGEVVDEISRTILIPATPISDSGLTISDDSLNTDGFPNVELIFSTLIDETGQYVLNLEKENIFLYENSNRVSDFEIGKFTSGGSNLVDVVFVLDVSGSMGDNINDVRNNLSEFADSLVARGFDYRIGVVTFSTTVDNIWDLTNDVEDIKNKLAGINLWGGIEDSPSALIEASKLSFREGSRRTIIWITDEPYPEEVYTKQEVVNKMLETGIAINGVGLLDLKSDWFDPLIIPTGGQFFDIFGNFRDILLAVSHMEAQNIYKLSYSSTANSINDTELKLEIRYAGLGGNKIFKLNESSAVPVQNEKLLSCYPNPFNPSITFKVSNKNILSGKLQIFNSIGQLVKEFNFDNKTPPIVWNAVNNSGLRVSSGMYFVRAVITDVNNRKYFETSKILYLK